jgi:hypothetical protein
MSASTARRWSGDSHFNTVPESPEPANDARRGMDSQERSPSGSLSSANSYTSHLSSGRSSAAAPPQINHGGYVAPGNAPQNHNQRNFADVTRRVPGPRPPSEPFPDGAVVSDEAMRHGVDVMRSTRPGMEPPTAPLRPPLPPDRPPYPPTRPVYPPKRPPYPPSMRG